MTASRHAHPDAVRPAAAFSPTWCCEYELATGEVTAVSARNLSQRRVRALVRVHGEPLGYVSITTPTVSLGPDTGQLADGLDAMARSELGDPLRRHLDAEGLPLPPQGRHVDGPSPRCPTELQPRESVTVVVCTRNRSQILAGCLSRLQALAYPALEILVVDNAPTDSATHELVTALAAADPRVRYTTEPRPGLSCARNHGLAHATGEIIAYTDDDVSVDARWVHGLVRGFRRDPRVGCVTGLVCTAEITSPAEAYFDARAASWSQRLQPRLYDLSDHRLDDALYPYSAGIFGTGANFAFRRSVLKQLGGFDERLGVGTPTRGGEDLDMFVRLLRAGHTIASEPSAVVWHHHRADEAALLRQMYGYGTGLAAYATKCLLQRGTRGDVLRRLPRAAARVTAIREQTQNRLEGTVRAPQSALARELWGFVAGPALYARSVRSSRGAAPRR